MDGSTDATKRIISLASWSIIIIIIYLYDNSYQQLEVQPATGCQWLDTWRPHLPGTLQYSRLNQVGLTIKLPCTKVFFQLYGFIKAWVHYLPRQRRGRGNRIGPVCVCVCVCVCACGLCVSIHHGNRTLGRGNFTTRVAGGASTLRRFH